MSAEVAQADEGDEIDPSELRLQVGLHDDPTNPVRELFDSEDQALKLEGDDSAFMTVKGSAFWCWAKDDNGQVKEGPAQRENLMAGLARSDSVEVLDVEDTPITGEERGYDL